MTDELQQQTVKPTCPWCWEPFETARERNEHAKTCGVTVDV